MNKKSDTIIRVIPFSFPISVLNSLCNTIITILIVIIYRLGIIQYIYGIIISPIIVLDQFIEVLILVAGSNVENRLVIIFS